MTSGLRCKTILNDTDFDLGSDPARYRLLLSDLPKKRFKQSMLIYLLNAAKTCIRLSPLCSHNGSQELRTYIPWRAFLCPCRVGRKYSTEGGSTGHCSRALGNMAGLLLGRTEVPSLHLPFPHFFFYSPSVLLPVFHFSL